MKAAEAAEAELCVFLVESRESNSSECSGFHSIQGEMSLRARRDFCTPAQQEDLTTISSSRRSRKGKHSVRSSGLLFRNQTDGAGHQ